MALSVTHTFVSAIPDDADASLVRPSNWNAAHTITGTVGNAALDDMAADTIKGRLSTLGAPQDLTGTQTTTLLDTFTSTLKGLAPSSGGGAVNFLRADGTWAAPAGSGIVSDGDKGDITVSSVGTVWTIDAGTVTLAKMANMATASFLGRNTAGTGAPEVLSVATSKTMLGLTGTNSGDQTITLTGDVTGTGTGSFAATIAADAVTYAKMQNVSATSRFIGRITSGSGDPEELTGTQATTLLDAFTTSLKGLAPSSGGGTTNFLRADGTWNAPPSGGTPAGASLTVQYNNASTFGGMSGTSWDDTNRSLTMTGATVTTSNPVLNMTQTWNAGAVTFNGLKLAITDTASATASLAVNILGGAAATTTLFAITKAGKIISTGSPNSGVMIGNSTTANTGTEFQDGSFFCSTSGNLISAMNRGGVHSVSTTTVGKFTWGPTATNANPGAPATTFLISPAAASVQQGDVDAATCIAQTFRVQSIVAGTANGTAGADWTFRASSGTGTGTGGNIIFQTPFSAKSSGTGQGTWVDRDIYVSKGKVLTSATPVSLFEIALPAGAMAGGTIYSTIICTNGTDMQSFSQSVSYSVVNKAGAYTKSITAATGDKSVTGASTLTTTWTLLDGTNKSTVQVSATTSLTPSTNAFICYYSMANNSEQATTIL